MLNNIHFWNVTQPDTKGVGGVYVLFNFLLRV